MVDNVTCQWCGVECVHALFALQTVPSLVEKAGEVTAASDILRTECMSRTDAVIFTPVQDPTKLATASMSLRRHLLFMDDNPVQKKPRRSQRLSLDKP